MLHFGDSLELPLNTVRSVRGSDGATWSKVDMNEGKPRGQFRGDAGEGIAISLYLHVGLSVAPRPFITRLRRLKSEGRIFQLWTTSGSYWGTFAVGDVQWQPTWTLPDGRVLAATVELTLEDPGVEVPQPLARPLALAGDANDTITVLPPENTTDEVSPEEIARL
ncbi:MAG TPA: phage tail protein [Polyangiaceae bacterium]|nr:phage tail protein [Polyangiaceae bacterium]